MQYDISKIIPQAFNKYIIVENTSDSLIRKTLGILEAIGSMDKWPRHNLLVEWMDEHNRNTFYKYFELRDTPHFAYTREDIPRRIANRSNPNPLTREELHEGVTYKFENFNMLFYKAPFSRAKEHVSSMRDAMEDLVFRWKLKKSGIGFFSDKFSKFSRVIGLDLRDFDDDQLARAFDTIDRIVARNTSIRIFCSYYTDRYLDDVFARYGKRVHTRKKSNDLAEDALIESIVLGKCDYLVGSELSDLFLLAELYSEHAELFELPATIQ